MFFRSLSEIDRSTAANDQQPSASSSARKNPQCIPGNTPPVFPGLRPRIWPHLLRLVTKAMSDRLLAKTIHISPYTLARSGRWFTAESRPRHRASHSAVSMVAKQRSHDNREINKHGGLAEVYLGKADLVRKDARDIDMLGIFGRT